MFGWFQSKCPVDAGSKEWTERRLAWLAAEFGWERLKSAEVILPHREFFPDPFDATHTAAGKLFERTCQYMDQDASRIELEFYRPDRTGRFDASGVPPVLNWAGLYWAESQKVRIRIDSSHLDDPESLVATYAHELAHAHLLGPGRILPNEPDCEPLTDLATVFFGLGIFGANVAFRQESYVLGIQHVTHHSRQGYLTAEQWAYALALFAWLRGEERPAWVRYLRHNVRGPCRAGMAYLKKAGDGILAAMTSGNVVRTSTVSATATAPAPEPDNAPADVSASESDQQEADMAEGDPFTTGMMQMRGGDWNAAVVAFSNAIAQSPEDGEAYQMRAHCLLEIGRFEEAVADAEESVRLEPEEPETLRVRGIAYLKTSRLEEAISDLSGYIREEGGSQGGDTSRLSRAYYFRGLAHAQSNNARAAIADYSKAIMHWPGWPEPYEARAECYERVEEATRAEADRREAKRRRRL